MARISYCYRATILASHMVRGGQKVISIRSKMSTARKGMILRATAPRLSPDMEPETIRHMPMGGVSMPMARLTTTIAPRWRERRRM